MKFSPRKRRSSISAHVAATSPYGPRAASAGQQQSSTYYGEGTRGFIQKFSLRRRNKSNNLRSENDYDAELVDSAMESDATVTPGTASRLALPILIVTPPSLASGESGENTQSAQNASGLPRSGAVTSIVSSSPNKYLKLMPNMDWVTSVFRWRRSTRSGKSPKQHEQEEEDGVSANGDGNENENGDEIVNDDGDGDNVEHNNDNVEQNSSRPETNEDRPDVLEPDFRMAEILTLPPLDLDFRAEW